MTPSKLSSSVEADVLRGERYNKAPGEQSLVKTVGACGWRLLTQFHNGSEGVGTNNSFRQIEEENWPAIIGVNMQEYLPTSPHGTWEHFENQIYIFIYTYRLLCVLCTDIQPVC